MQTSVLGTYAIVRVKYSDEKLIDFALTKRQWVEPKLRARDNTFIHRRQEEKDSQTKLVKVVTNVAC